MGYIWPTSSSLLTPDLNVKPKVIFFLNNDKSFNSFRLVLKQPEEISSQLNSNQLGTQMDGVPSILELLKDLFLCDLHSLQLHKDEVRYFYSSSSFITAVPFLSAKLRGCQHFHYNASISGGYKSA